MTKPWKIFLVASRHWLPAKLLLETSEVRVEAPTFTFRRRQPRKKRVDILTAPLLPGILFVAVEDCEKAIELCKAKSIRLRSLPPEVGDGHCLDEELEGLRLAAAKRTDARSRLSAGDRVRIDYGPLKGRFAAVSKIGREAAELIVEGSRFRTVISPFLLRKITS